MILFKKSNRHDKCLTVSWHVWVSMMILSIIWYIQWWTYQNQFSKSCIKFYSYKLSIFLSKLLMDMSLFLTFINHVITLSHNYHTLIKVSNNFIKVPSDMYIIFIKSSWFHQLLFDAVILMSNHHYFFTSIYEKN